MATSAGPVLPPIKRVRQEGGTVGVFRLGGAPPSGIGPWGPQYYLKTAHYLRMLLGGGGGMTLGIRVRSRTGCRRHDCLWSWQGHSEKTYIDKDFVGRCLRLPYFIEWLEEQVLGLAFRERAGGLSYWGDQRRGDPLE